MNVSTRSSMRMTASSVMMMSSAPMPQQMTRRGPKEKAAAAPMLFRCEQNSRRRVHHRRVDMRFEAGEVGREHGDQSPGLPVIGRLVRPGLTRIEDRFIAEARRR